MEMANSIFVQNQLSNISNIGTDSANRNIKGRENQPVAETFQRAAKQHWSLLPGPLSLSFPVSFCLPVLASAALQK